jgi:hypothetical protein
LRLFPDGRQPFLYRIGEELPVIRPQSAVARGCIGPIGSAIGPTTWKQESNLLNGLGLSFQVGPDARAWLPTQGWWCLSRIVGTVPKRTVLVWSRCHPRSLMKKKAKKEFGRAILASVKKEMTKPRLTMSAREGEINEAAGRAVRAKRANAKLRLHPLPLLRRAR